MAGLHSPKRIGAVAIALLAIYSISAARQAIPGSAPAPLATPLATTPAGALPGTLKQAPGAKTAPVAAAAVAKPWKELTAPQRLALAPFAAEWDRMEATRKQKWLEIANRYAAMKPDEQQRVQERMREWIKLTPDERRMARENYTLSKKIDKSKKSDSWNAYQQLSDDEKKKLAADAAIAKKQVTALPPKAQGKTVAPIKATTLPCPAGTVKNPAAALPACIAAVAPAPGAAPGAAAVALPGAAPSAPPPAAPLPAASVVPAPAPASPPAAVTPPPPTPPGNPAAPATNVK